MTKTNQIASWNVGQPSQHMILASPTCQQSLQHICRPFAWCMFTFVGTVLDPLEEPAYGTLSPRFTIREPQQFQSNAHACKG